jgi:hypothetical protein
LKNIEIILYNNIASNISSSPPDRDMLLEILHVNAHKTLSIQIGDEVAPAFQWFYGIWVSWAAGAGK